MGFGLQSENKQKYSGYSKAKTINKKGITMLKWELIEEYKEVIYEKAKPGYSAVARVRLTVRRE